MVIAKKEWFEGKEGSYLGRYDVAWQGAIYLIIMLGFPLALGFIFLLNLIVIAAGYYQNIDIVIMSIAWLTFSLADLLDIARPEPPFKSYDEDKDFIISVRNAGWIMSLIMLTGAAISIVYHIYSWNFYLGLFATTAFVACMVIAITKYRFEKKNQNDNYSKSQIEEE